MKDSTDDAKTIAQLAPVLVLTAGLALGLSFLPLPLGWLSAGALVPLLLLWERMPWVPRLFAEIYTAFLLCYGISLFWPLVLHFEDAPRVAVSSLFVVPLLWTLPFAASLPFLKRFGRSAGLAALMVFFLATETILSRGPMPFPWPSLGHTHAELLPLIQFVEATGETGLTLWVLILNVLLFTAVAPRRRDHRRTAVAALALVVLVGAAYGVLSPSRNANQERHVTMGLVQPALSPEAWTRDFGGLRLRRMTALSDSLITAMNAPPIFIVWPEMALPAPLSAERARYVERSLRAWTQRGQVALLTGALLKGPSRGQFYNGAVLMSPDGTRQRYLQTLRSPARRRVPLRQEAPWFSNNPEARFVAGVQQTPLQLDGIRLGLLVGFEVLVSEHARRAVQDEADVLVALTSAGWWHRHASTHNLRYARLRALETRHSVVLVGAGGVTALVAPDGRVIHRSQTGHASAQLVAVPLSSRTTLYQRTGNLLGWGSLILAGLQSIWLVLTGLWWTLRNDAKHTFSFAAPAAAPPKQNTSYR